MSAHTCTIFEGPSGRWGVALDGRRIPRLLYNTPQQAALLAARLAASEDSTTPPAPPLLSHPHTPPPPLPQDLR